MKAELLLKLAEHLESENLGHKRFDFTTYNVGVFSPGTCGTNGCAIGECPVIFQEDWEFSPKHSMPILRYNKGDNSTEGCARIFFDITNDEFFFLFVPRMSGNTPAFLGADATAKEVSKHIRKFVDHGGIYIGPYKNVI